MFRMRSVIRHTESEGSAQVWDSRFNRTVPTPPLSISNKELYNLTVCRVPSTADTRCSIVGFARSTTVK